FASRAWRLGSMWATRTTRTPSTTSAAATGCSCRPKARPCCCCRRWRSTSGPPREDWTFWRARYDAPPASTMSSPRQLQSACMSVKSHFATKDPSVFATYRRVVDVARTFGPVAEETKKTSIHLVRHTAFAGIATRRSSLVLTLKSAGDIRSPRVEKREQTSANRWHVDVRLTAPAQVDRQLTAWLRAAYELA